MLIPGSSSRYRKEEWDEKKLDCLVHYLVPVDGVATID